MLKVEGLSSGYRKKKVVFEASFSVGKEELVYIWGPPSSGKSTLLKTIVGKVKPTSGKKTFEGRDLTKVRPEEIPKLGIAFIPQKGGHFDGLAVQEHFQLVLKEPMPPQNLLNLMKELGFQFEKMRSLKARKLELLDKRILGMFTALAISPKLLIYDEPFEGLEDPKPMARALRLVKDRLRLTMLIVSRTNPEESSLNPDKVYFMRNGFLTS
jgi:ABC-type branched-subunit amino acid transport system ATPase component